MRHLLLRWGRPNHEAIQSYSPLCRSRSPRAFPLHAGKRAVLWQLAQCREGWVTKRELVGGPLVCLAYSWSLSFDLFFPSTAGPRMAHPVGVIVYQIRVGYD